MTYSPGPLGVSWLGGGDTRRWILYRPYRHNIILIEYYKYSSLYKAYIHIIVLYDVLPTCAAIVCACNLIGGFCFYFHIT